MLDRPCPPSLCVGGGPPEPPTQGVGTSREDRQRETFRVPRGGLGLGRSLGGERSKQGGPA